MKYKVGDRVKVREGLIPYQEYGTYCFVRGMIPYIGRKLTITEVCNNSRCYTAKGKSNIWCWTDEMLEPIGNES